MGSQINKELTARYQTSFSLRYQAFFSLLKESPVRVTLVGSYLDNAFGEWVNPRAILGGYQELVIIADGYSKGQELANLANLLAWVRLNSKDYNGPHQDLLNQILEVTADCRLDMHEPDNQGLTVYVTSGKKYRDSDSYNSYFIELNINEDSYKEGSVTFFLEELVDIVRHLSQG